jgi:acyl-CoA dehydrogenase
LAAALEEWCAANLPVAHGDVDAACKGLVAALGGGRLAAAFRRGRGRAAGCAHAVPDPRDAGAARCLADFAFAMQGLGMGAVSLFGTALAAGMAGRTRAGQGDFAFALTEPGSGSDVAAPRPRPIGCRGLAADGEKTWISNGGIADVYVIFARTGEAPGARGLSAFLMPADVPGCPWWNGWR